MVSMCCGDCRTEKLKTNLFNKILLNEHCKNISEYLSCDDCIKMNAILNDPIYKTLDPEQQQIFMYIKLCPFPEWVKEIDNYSQYVKKKEEAYNNMYVQNFCTKNFKKFNDEFFPCEYIDLFDAIFAMCDAEWVNGRFRIEFDRELRRKILHITGAWNYY